MDADSKVGGEDGAARPLELVLIGLGGHSSSCIFAVLSEKGKTLWTDVVETNGQSLMEYLRLIPGHLNLCLEEGAQSGPRRKRFEGKHPSFSWSHQLETPVIGSALRRTE